ncbi:MAG: ACP S-malonyltransferase [Lachnospiraceae bacterium]|nr:ACP S-malonyltransferase [Lachnospiraceae bacterium]
MSKVAFMFPGQGAQYVGMGKDFYETYDTAKKVFELASEVSGLDIADICFTENDKLNITEYTQIAMLATEVSILKVLEENGVHADICAGLSLGEYGALAAADVCDLEDLFALIRKRGIYMQQAYPVGGAMTAVLGLNMEDVDTVCKQCEGIVSVANDNCPGQIVITGEEQAVNRAAELLKEKGAKRCIPLTVSGPFHSKLLEGAGEKLAKELSNVTLRDPKIPYVCNLECAPVTKKDRIAELLEKQVSGTVRFRESIEYMIADGVDVFIEVGPGKTLSGFVKKINRDVKVYQVATVEDLQNLCRKEGNYVD